MSDYTIRLRALHDPEDYEGEWYAINDDLKNVRFGEAHPVVTDTGDLPPLGTKVEVGRIAQVKHLLTAVDALRNIEGSDDIHEDDTYAA